MPLKPQSIRKGVVIWLNNEKVEKQELIAISEFWSETQLNFFKKMLKQGGEFKISNNKFKIELAPKITTSKGELDTGVITIPGLDSRF